MVDALPNMHEDLGWISRSEKTTTYQPLYKFRNEHLPYLLNIQIQQFLKSVNSKT